MDSLSLIVRRQEPELMRVGRWRWCCWVCWRRGLRGLRARTMRGGLWIRCWRMRAIRRSIAIKYMYLSEERSERTGGHLWTGARG